MGTPRPCQICGGRNERGPLPHEVRTRHRNFQAIAPFVARGLVPLPFHVAEFAQETIPGSELHQTGVRGYQTIASYQITWDPADPCRSTWDGVVYCCSADAAEDLLRRLHDAAEVKIYPLGGYSGEIDKLAQSIEAAQLCAEGVPWWQAWVRTSRLLAENGAEWILRFGASDRHGSIFWTALP